MVEDTIYEILKAHEEAGNVEKVDEHRSNLKVQIASVPDGRFISTIPDDVVEGFHQLDADVRQIG